MDNQNKKESSLSSVGNLIKNSIQTIVDGTKKTAEKAKNIPKIQLMQ